MVAHLDHRIFSKPQSAENAEPTTTSARGGTIVRAHTQNNAVNAHTNSPTVWAGSQVAYYCSLSHSESQGHASSQPDRNFGCRWVRYFSKPCRQARLGQLFRFLLGRTQTPSRRRHHVTWRWLIALGEKSWFQSSDAGQQPAGANKT